MNPDDLARLLYRGESEALDFKRTLYRFQGLTVTDEEKAELLKDILAFANSWRSEPAHIILGVDERRGGKKSVVGVNAKEHPDDAWLQEFVNKKTNRPIRFGYVALEYQAKSIGVIRFDHPQERPVFLERDYGGLRAHTVYIRRGSSTDIASPDEIADMGRAVAAPGTIGADALRIEFVEPTSQEFLGGTLIARPGNLTLLENRDPQRSDIPNSLRQLLSHNSERETAAWKAVAYAKYYPLSFGLVNRGSVTAQDVRIQLTAPNTGEGVELIDEGDHPRYKRGSIGFMDFPLPRVRTPFLETWVSVKSEGSSWSVNIEAKKLQPKRPVLISSEVFVAAEKDADLCMDGFMYADNLPQPVPVSLALQVRPIAQQMTIDQAASLIEGLDP